jgi:hypothetical protein
VPPEKCSCTNPGCLHSKQGNPCSNNAASGHDDCWACFTTKKADARRARARERLNLLKDAR